jgi:hypothetical protein
MQCKKEITAYFYNHKRHTNALSGQNGEFLDADAVGTCTDQNVLKAWLIFISFFSCCHPEVPQ